MFEHSVKVPRHYKVAANIFKKVSTEGGSIKTLLYDNKLKHFRTNVLYALLTETIKHAADIDKIFENCSLLEKESRLDPWLAKILAAELLFGKKALSGKSKPEQTILSYKDQFEKYTKDHHDDLKTEVVRRPRYIRINTNLLTTSDAIGAFQDEGYRFIRCTSGSYDDYLKQIQQLTEYDFTQDYHVKTVFVFSSNTKLHQHELYLGNKIILQDKATTMAVHLLAPPPGSVILDMCAAPGMKTTQLAAYIRNQGRIYAVERNEKRYQTLCEFVEKTGSKCVETLNRDSLDIKRGELDDVEYILLDPSCSGSGMELCVHNYIEDTRLAKLTSLQEKFLKHAMNSFPKAKRIVYSTCSLFPEENERVITNVVKTSRAKWRVQDVKELLKGQWNNIGSGMYGSMGTRCMYAKPDSDMTTGFFLAVLDRDEKDLEKRLNYQKESKECVPDDNASVKNSDEKETLTNLKDISFKKKKKKNKQCYDKLHDQDILTNNDQDTSKSELQVNAHESDNEIVCKKKKKKKDIRNETDEQDDTIINGSAAATAQSEAKAKKRIKNKSNEENVENDYELTENNSPDNHDQPSKKRKKSKNGNGDHEDVQEILDAPRPDLQTVESIKEKKKKRKKVVTVDS